MNSARRGETDIQDAQVNVLQKVREGRIILEDMRVGIYWRKS